MPHRSLVPNSSPCIPRSDAAASGRVRNALPDDPTHGKTKNAARCMGIRSALRWRMQCAAWAHAPHCVFGGRTAGLWLQRTEGVSHRHCQCPRKGFPCAIISAGRDGPKPCQGRKIGLHHLVCPICPEKREWRGDETSISNGSPVPFAQENENGAEVGQASRLPPSARMKTLKGCIT